MCAVIGNLLALARPSEAAAPPGAEAPPARRSDASTLSWNFDKHATGEWPDGLRVASTHSGKAPAKWAIQADPTAPSKPNVLRLLETRNTGHTYNLLVFDHTSLRDLDLRVALKANSGEEDQGGGLIWRCKDENNYYICRLNPLESNFRVYKVEGGKRTQFKSAEVRARAGQWYTIRVVMIGDDIHCDLDGKELLTAKDATFKDAGKIGLWTKADAASSFDDLTASEIRPPVGERPAPSGG